MTSGKVCPKDISLRKNLLNFPAVGIALEINLGKKEKHKNMETKQHANGSKKKSKRKSENTLRQMNMETQLSKICGTQQKQF